jgi:hypothetical protein
MWDGAIIRFSFPVEEQKIKSRWIRLDSAASARRFGGLVGVL